MKKASASYGLLGISAIVYIALGYATQQTNFTQLVLLFATCFAGYVFVLNNKIPVWHGIIAAIVFRLLLLSATPALSTEFWRYIWDGKLLASGINPYLYLPSWFIQQDAIVVPGINESLFLQLNSPELYSSYLPVLQAVFWLAAEISPQNITVNIIAIRVVILLAEIGSILLLLRLVRKMALPDNYSLLYALNPLVILELTGNLHMEALLIFLVLLCLFLLFYHRVFLAGVALGLAIGVKLLPLLFLPFIWRKLGVKQSGIFMLTFLVTAIVVYYPLAVTEAFQHGIASLQLQLERSEFNASVYYLMRWLGWRFTGINQQPVLGPILLLTIIVIVASLASLKKMGSVRRLTGYMAAALTVFLLLSTTVQPWFITTLVALTAASHFRYAVAWSGLAILSYAAYRTGTATEDMVLIALEYTIVLLWLTVEIYLYRQRDHLHNLR